MRKWQFPIFLGAITLILVAQVGIYLQERDIAMRNRNHTCIALSDYFLQLSFLQRANADTYVEAAKKALQLCFKDADV